MDALIIIGQEDMKVSIGVVAIFVVTFSLVFFFFTMVEYNLSCLPEQEDALIPDCQIMEGKFGDFMLGVFIVGVLAMLDMGIVYKLLVDYFV
jgi:hypothetical protein